MLSATLTIEPKSDPGKSAAGRRSRRQAPKGRAFSANLLALLCADHFLDPGEGETLRPIFAMFAGAEQELASFVANLRGGRKARITDGRVTHGVRYQQDLEFQRSARFRYASQPIDLDGQRSTVTTAYLPEASLFDPPLIPPEGPAFVLYTPTWWTRAQEDALAAHPDRDRITRAILARGEALGLNGRSPFGGPWSAAEQVEIALLGARFAGCLDHYTHKPIPKELDFFLHLYLAALAAGVAGLAQHVQAAPAADPRWTWARTALATEWNFAAVGLHPAVLVSVATDQLDAFLAEQVHRYYTASMDLPLERCA